MVSGRFINVWTVAAVLLVVIIAAGGIAIWSGYSRSKAIEISMVPDPGVQGEVYIDGEVSNPGLYPLQAGDSIEDILRAAGSTTDSADLNGLKLVVPGPDEGETPQKININRAEAWLLEALPGIGEVRARAIIDYRQRNGRFRNVNELVNVEGISTVTYEEIRHLITVAD